jgi:hypothetical protein
LRACFLEDALGSGVADSSTRELPIPSDEHSGSWYVRRDEQAERAKASLGSAMGELVARLKDNHNFRDLKILEMIFYGQIRNKVAGEIIGIDEKQIALIKHRMIKDLREKLTRGGSVAGAETTDSMLTAVWEEQRFTCPKRSTIGRFLLGTLEEPWNEYVDFHVNRLGCRFCRANVEDLQKGTEAEHKKVQQKIFESTIGFFRPGGV